MALEVLSFLKAIMPVPVVFFNQYLTFFSTVPVFKIQKALFFFLKIPKANAVLIWKIVVFQDGLVSIFSVLDLEIRARFKGQSIPS